MGVFEEGKEEGEEEDLEDEEGPRSKRIRHASSPGPSSRRSLSSSSSSSRGLELLYPASEELELERREGKKEVAVIL